jgi:hypothetical protein
MRTSFILLVIAASISVEIVNGQGYNYYGGNIHAHTKYSDGNQDWKKTDVKTPTKSYEFARKSKNFNFLGISEHNHHEAGMNKPSYALGLKEADDADKADGDSFVCMYGMEFGVIENGGHVLIYGVDELIGWEKDNYDVKCAKSDYASLWTLLADYPGAFATLAHPVSSDYGNLINKSYNQAADDILCGVAIMTGPAKTDDDQYGTIPAKTFMGYFRNLLALGYHVGPTVDHDNHKLTFGRMAPSRTIVLAKKLTRKDIMEAYREMRFFASADWNAQVSFVINNHPMGSRINTKSDAKIKVAVTDGDAGDKVKSIKLMYGEPGTGKLSTVLSTSNTNTLTFTQPIAKGQEYYFYLDITQGDGDNIVTSPIWAHRVTK